MFASTRGPPRPTVLSRIDRCGSAGQDAYIAYLSCNCVRPAVHDRPGFRAPDGQSGGFGFPEPLQLPAQGDRQFRLFLDDRTQPLADFPDDCQAVPPIDVDGIAHRSTLLPDTTSAEVGGFSDLGAVESGSAMSPLLYIS